MSKPTPIEIQERFRNLPQDLKEAILSVDSADVIQNIEKKYRLTVEKAGELADEVGFLMMGFTKPENFIGDLQKRLGVDFETARGITEDLNVQIFAKVRESLKRAHTLEENPAVPVPKTPPAMSMPPSTVPQTPASPAPLPPSPFESKLQEKVFSVQKELSQARADKVYPGGADPYREPVK